MLLTAKLRTTCKLFRLHVPRNDLDTCQSCRYHVNTNHVMYQKVGISFLGISAMDQPHFLLLPLFDSAANFIDEALKNNGKVLVHCREGYSRAPTFVVAYLMLKRRMPVLEALRTVRAKREVEPNGGFQKQLCVLHRKLQEQGHFTQNKAQV